MAIAGPRVLSRQQQELVCLRSGHVDCLRYRRATAGVAPTARGRLRVPRLPPATTAALIILALSAGVSFGFVIQRGGIDLPAAAVSGSASPSAARSVAPGGSALPVADATTAPSPSAIATPSAPPSSDASPSDAASPAATPTPSPVATPTPTPKPKPSATPAPSARIPSADRLAVIKPCPGQPGCWIYTVRAGDNLWSIAHWFGVPLDTIYAWNPTVRQAGIHAGDPLRIPTPTR